MPGATSATSFVNLVASFNQPVVALTLMMARPLGVSILLPPFGRLGSATLIRAAFSFAYAIPALQTGQQALGQLGAGGQVGLALLMMKEVFVGTLLGFLLALPVWAIAGTGELLDAQRGATQQGLSEPGTSSQLSSTDGLLSTAAITAFIISGGLKTTAGLLYGSYAVWPVERAFPTVSAGFADYFLDTLSSLLRQSVMVAAPLIAAMLSADVGAMLLARTVPRLGVYDLAATLRNLVFVAGLVVYIRYLSSYTLAGSLESSAALARLRTLLP